MRAVNNNRAQRPITLPLAGEGRVGGMKRRFVMTRLISWLVRLCVLAATLPVPAHALAPKSSLQDDKDRRDLQKVMEQEEKLNDHASFNVFSLSDEEIEAITANPMVPPWLDWKKASWVKWRELVRDDDQAKEGPVTLRQVNYFNNQVDVRAALLGLMGDVAAGAVNNPDQFIDRYRAIHRILLLGKNGDSIYVSYSTGDPDEDIRTAQVAAGRLLDETHGRNTLV